MQFDQMTKVKMKRRSEENEVQEGPQCVIYKEATPLRLHSLSPLPVSLPPLYATKFSVANE